MKHLEGTKIKAVRAGAATATLAVQCVKCGSNAYVYGVLDDFSNNCHHITRDDPALPLLMVMAHVGALPTDFVPLEELFG